MKGMGGHQSHKMLKDEWLTPCSLLDKLGRFDLDPCAPAKPPWPIADKHFSLKDDGLSQPWEGRVWLNPPYGKQAEKWLTKLADHGRGTALIFARTETEMFMRCVWLRASAVLFLYGRLTFHHVDGTPAKHNGGAPSVLVAYGEDDADRLWESGLAGAYIETKDWEVGVAKC